MTDTRSDDKGALPAGLEDVIRTAGEVADRVREAASAVARLGERELAMLATIGEEMRDSVVAPERLESARRRETIQALRKTAHRGVDLGFDAAAVTVDIGVDLLDAAMRRGDRKPKVTPGPAGGPIGPFPGGASSGPAAASQPGLSAAT